MDLVTLFVNDDIGFESHQLLDPLKVGFLDDGGVVIL